MKAERKNIQWEHSYSAGDKTFMYVTVVHKMTDPITAEG
jgi:hypothetical protein